MAFKKEDVDKARELCGCQGCDPLVHLGGTQTQFGCRFAPILNAIIRHRNGDGAAKRIAWERTYNAALSGLITIDADSDWHQHASDAADRLHGKITS